jgi:tRNA nucleotidyltransferase (CCA-adding enzyme)
MLRAVRFEQRFGFRIEERTSDLLREALPLFGRVSGDRIRHELDHILDEANFVAMFERLNELELLAAIHIELGWDEWTRMRFQMLREYSTGNLALCAEAERLAVKDLAYNILLMRMPVKIAAEVTKRLKYPAFRAKIILASSQLWSQLEELVDLPASRIVSRLEDIPLQSVYACCLASLDMRIKELLQAYLEKWRKVTPTITGHDLRQRGITPGPAYGRILNELRRAWLDSQITNQEEEQTLLNRLIADEQN